MFLKVRKFCTALAVCLLIFGTCAAVQAANAPAAPKIKDARAYLEKVSQAAAQLEGMRADIAIDWKAPLFSFSSVSRADLFLREPLQVKMTTEGAVSGIKAHDFKFSIEQYVVQKKDTAISYVGVDGKWTKQIFPYSPLQEMYSSENALSYVKRVKIREQTDDLVALDVVVDMEKIRGQIDQVLKEAMRQVAAKQSKPMDLEQAQKIIQQVFQAIGDVAYTMTADKKTDRVVNIYMDLSRPAQKAAALVIEQAPLPEREKEELRALTKEIALVIQEDFSQFNAAERFEIPAEAVKAAVQRQAKPSVSDEALPEEIESGVL